MEITYDILANSKPLKDNLFQNEMLDFYFGISLALINICLQEILHLFIYIYERIFKSSVDSL